MIQDSKGQIVAEKKVIVCNFYGTTMTLAKLAGQKIREHKAWRLQQLKLFKIAYGKWVRFRVAFEEELVEKALGTGVRWPAGITDEIVRGWIDEGTLVPQPYIERQGWVGVTPVEPAQVDQEIESLEYQLGLRTGLGSAKVTPGPVEGEGEGVAGVEGVEEGGSTGGGGATTEVARYLCNFHEDFMS